MRNSSIRSLLLVSSLLLFVFSTPSLSQDDTCMTSVTNDCSGPNANWVALQADSSESYPTCAPVSTNVAFGSDGSSSVMTLGIASTDCPTSCATRPYSCAQVETVPQTQYGSYSCVIKTANHAGTQSSCYFATSGSGTYFQTIYFQFWGTNTTQVHVGFYANGVQYPDTIIPLTFRTDMDFHTYTFSYNENVVEFYVDTVLLKRVSPDFAGQYQMPSLPGLYMVNYITGAGDKNSIQTLGPYDGLPDSISVRSLAYTAAPCLNNTESESSSEASGNPFSGPADCTVLPPFYVYSDSLNEGWTDTSTSKINFQSTYPVRNGQYAIAFDVKQGAQLTLQFYTTIMATQYQAISLWVNGGTMGQQQVTLSLTSGGGPIASVNLGDYTGFQGIPQNGWMRMIIPLSDFYLVATESFDGILVKPAYSAFMGTLSIDEMKFIYGDPCIGDTQIIYGDALDSNWKDQSFGSVDLKSTNQVEVGTYSIEFDLFDADAIYFHTDAGFSSTDFQGFKFDIFNTVKQPKMTVFIAQNNQLGGNFELANYYSGSLPVNQWFTVMIFWEDLGVYPGTTLDGFQIKADTNDYQGTVYIENVELFAVATELGSDGSDALKFNSNLPFLAFLFISTWLFFYSM
eukprot:TRINITY_DN6260_c0_g2_i2.p1 TRINITY_DN6260_c0_g2~~TRINITY_DN6260_c0_g2_i2.p1  ORF type:complete len:627 (+),score=91.17 TRINITY_DN6260_c0_g2_i2:291-2171(+)